MSRTAFTIFIALICGIFVYVFSACSPENKKKWEWSARLKDGRIVTEQDLKWTRDTLIEFQITSNAENRIEKCEKGSKELRSIESKKDNLEEANLSNACLGEINLKGVNLKKVHLYRANLRKAILEGADLRGANLIGANLSRTNLRGADLRDANLSFADLSAADFRDADLRGADLSGATLKNTDLREAKGLIEIRENFKTAGNRDNERLVTYNIKLAEWEKSALGGTLNKIKSMFNLIFFELTCEYGRKPVRPLIILICFIPYFAFFYIFALMGKNRETGIWLVLPKKGQIESPIKKRAFRLTQKFAPGSSPAGTLSKMKFKICCRCRMVRIGFYFSLLCALNIGWRAINTKNLITRLQRRNYALSATGWARSLGGIQSLLSIFLLMLWLLTTFGHPF
jgi:hypothetical protein